MHLGEGLRQYWLTRRIARAIGFDETRVPTWTDPDSRFALGVRRFLDKSQPGLADRCELKRFEWSGSNSIHARTQAARDFRDYLLRETTADAEACHLIVAHSHGGMVAFLALTGQGSAPLVGRIGGLLTMGTPFLSMAAETSALRIVAHGILPAGLALFAGALEITLLTAGYRNMAGWLAAVTVSLALSMIAVPWLAARRGSTVAGGLRMLLDILLPGLWIAAAWVAFTGIAAGGTPSAVEAVSGQFARLARALLGGAAATATLALLVLARAGGMDREPGAWMLRDLISTAAVLLTAVVVSVASAWAFVSSDRAVEMFAAFVIFWPVLALFAAFALSDGGGRPGERIMAVLELEFENQTIPELPCPLHALRLPGDEATLAIVASQLARSLPSAVGDLVDRMARVKRLPWWFWAIGVAGAFAGATAYSFSGLSSVVAGIAYIVVGVVGAGAVTLVLFLAAMAALLVGFMLSAAVMATAVGPDVARLIPAVRLDCEALPRCRNPEMCRLTIQWRLRRPRRLRHELYTLRPIQRRVGEWLAERAAASHVSASMS